MRVFKGLKEDGFKIKKRTDYHFSIFDKNNFRVDFFPKRKKYHIIESNERGILKGDIRNLFPILNIEDIEIIYDELYLNYLVGKKIKLIHQKKWYAMYCYESEEIIFNIFTKAKTRPEELVLPKSKNVLLKKGNQIYVDAIREGVVIWINNLGMKFKKYDNCN